MSKLLILACLLAAAAPASADPKCAPSGKPIFQISKSPKAPGTGPIATQALYANGAYTADATDQNAKSTQHVTGVCVSDKQLADAKAALKDATWTVTVARIKCMARSNEQTVYAADGKPVFTETLCSGQSLDAKSAAALETLKAILATPPAAK